jgi:two-component system, chemotaxis family, protein-glutamate methylesterase/glutaminase
MQMAKYGIVVIGGSWGGIGAAMKILKDLPPDYPLPILLILHRLKGGLSGMASIFQKEVSLQVKEIDEKEPINRGTLYIAPADYHTLIEKNMSFSLDVSEPVNYCRPSIDITFESAAEIYGEKTIGIILSGNNNDGSFGLLQINKKGGEAIVQDPDEAEADSMPLAALKKVTAAKSMKLEEISIFLQLIK